jgi:hypothetical protein
MPIGVLEHVGCVHVPLFLSSWPTGNIVLGLVGKEVQRDHSIRLDVEVEGETEIGMLRRRSGAGDDQLIDPRSPIHSNSPKGKLLRRLQ